MSPRDRSPVMTLSPRRPSGQEHGNQMSPLHNLTLLQLEQTAGSPGQRRIVLDDVMLACNCLAMETQSTMFRPHSFCADIKTSGSLELFIYATFTNHVLQHSVTHSVTLHGLLFIAELLLFLNASTFQ